MRPHWTQKPDKWINPQRRWFNDRIADLHSADGPISQNTVAAFLGIDRSHFMSRLDGAIKFKPEEMVHLAGIFGVDPGEMLQRCAALRQAWERYRKTEKKG